MKCWVLLVVLTLMPGVPPPLAGSPAGYPYFQGFDSITPPALPEGWLSSQHRTQGQNDFVTTLSSPRSLPNALLSTNATVEQYLVSPPFDFLGVNPDRLSFFTRRSSSHHAKLVVEASLDSGRTYTVLLGDTLTNTGQTSYVLSSFVLPDSFRSHEDVRFRWRIVPDVTGATGTLRIDDISITVKTLADLALFDLRVVPARPAEGDSVTVVASVRNVGVYREEGFRVDLFADVNSDSIPQPAERYGSAQSSTWLDAGDAVDLRASLGVVPAGELLLIGELFHPDDQNPSNNRRVVKVIVGAARGGIVINEIQYAPAGGEPEWVEVYNTTAGAINLKNWSLTDNNASVKHVIRNTDLFVSPNGFAVLTKDSAAFVEVRSRFLHPPIMVPGFPSLNNAGDAIVLFDMNGAPVDSLAYLATWGGGSGKSLERIDPSRPSTDSTNWATSEDSTGSTPGEQNSVATLEFDLRLLQVTATRVMNDSVAEIRASIQNAGKQNSSLFQVLLYDDANRDSIRGPAELFHSLTVSQPLQYRESLVVVIRWNRPSPGMHQVIAVVEDARDLRPTNNTRLCSLAVPFETRTMIVNEIMYAPGAGKAEYVELLNCSRYDVDLADWTLLDRPSPGGNSNRVIVTREHRFVHPGELYVIAGDSTILSSFPYLRDTEPRLLTIISQGALNLNNEGDDAVLKDGGEATIDSVAYSGGWNNPGVADPTGRSLERIRPLGGSNDARNWSTCANSLGGTPGKQNSILAVTVPTNARLSISPNPFSPDGDGTEDFSVIQYAVPLEVSMVCIRIFDVKGRLIRRLANNEPSGALGSVIWDGRDEERQKARIGLYIVLLEALNERMGVLESARGIIVLAARL